MKDAGKFATMYQTWWKIVRDAADRVLQSQADARDVTQDVFMRLWESGDWRKIDDPEAFFARAGRNGALTLLQQRRRWHKLAVAHARLDELYSRGPSPQDVVLASEQRDRLLQALGFLPPRCRLVCALVFVDRLTHREAAEKLGISIGAVEKQVARARRQLMARAESGEIQVSDFVDGGGVGWFVRQRG